MRMPNGLQTVIEKNSQAAFSMWNFRQFLGAAKQKDRLAAVSPKPKRIDCLTKFVSTWPIRRYASADV